jgi:hypothetical protein
MSTELTQSFVKRGRPEIQKIVNFIWDEANILQQRKNSTVYRKKSTVYLFRKDDSVYHRVTVISCIQNLAIILLSVLNKHVDEIIGH